MTDWDPVAAIEPPAVEIKLFGRWNPDEVQVSDISLQVSEILGRILSLSKMMRHDCPHMRDCAMHNNNEMKYCAKNSV